MKYTYVVLPLVTVFMDPHGLFAHNVALNTTERNT